MKHESDTAPTAVSTLLRVDGMTCQNCARHVREAAASVSGVSGASVDLGSGRVRVRWVAGATPDVPAVVGAVERAGFRAAEAPAGVRSGAVRAAGRGWGLNLLVGGPVTAFLMVAEWGLGWAHAPWFGWLALALATPVQVICGARFYAGAWNQLKRGASNMDTLVSLGSTAAFGYSVGVLLGGGGGHVYFMESAAILTLVSVGHWLETLATERAAGALRALMQLTPQRALRVEADGTEREVSASELMPGDRVVLRPGDRVPTDAEVESGQSALNESMLTGESRPVEKRAGSKLYAGTVNADGRLVGRVTAAGEDTVLGHIIAAVERAQNSRAGIQRLADRVSSVFVPVVVGLAVLTGLAWGLAPETMRAVHGALAGWLWTVALPTTPVAAGIIHATAVLIIACPCAMGLATPAAIMAGTNAAALRGILIRDGVALEKAGTIRTVVFDKTGTLTQGKLEVVGVRDLRGEGGGSEGIEVLAASLARASRHPVSQAVALLAPAPRALPAVPGMKPAVEPATSGLGGGTFLLRGDLRFQPRGGGAGGWNGWKEQRGRGVEAERGGVVYRLGALGWLHENGVEDMAAEMGGARARGAAVTLVGLAAGARLIGLFELKDALRPEARGTVAELHRRGLEVYLVSGDAWLAAEAVGREAGVPASQVLAEVQPEQKAESVARLQREGRRVAFVGDGINDGPALAQADLGIAVSQATDVARESADVVLIRGGVGAVPLVLDVAERTLRTIRQNLFWAFFYNAVAVPLAMLGFFSPMVCALAMGFSDLVVIGNALRLRYLPGLDRRDMP